VNVPLNPAFHSVSALATGAAVVGSEYALHGLMPMRDRWPLQWRLLWHLVMLSCLVVHLMAGRSLSRYSPAVTAGSGILMISLAQMRVWRK